MLPEHLKEITIFYIDDVSYNFDFVKQFLKSQNHQGKIETATSYLGAIDEINKIYRSGKRVDLFICDLNLPEKDGIWFVEKVRSFKDERINNIPIIILSNEQDKTKLTKAIVSGADTTIEKPFNHDEMKDKMVRVIEKRLNKNRKG